MQTKQRRVKLWRTKNTPLLMFQRIKWIWTFDSYAVRVERDQICRMVLRKALRVLIQWHLRCSKMRKIFKVDNRKCLKPLWEPITWMSRWQALRKDPKVLCRWQELCKMSNLWAFKPAIKIKSFKTYSYKIIQNQDLVRKAKLNKSIIKLEKRPVKTKSNLLEGLGARVRVCLCSFGYPII